MTIVTSVTPSSGFGLLKSQRKAVPVDFDPASLLKSDQAKQAVDGSQKRHAGI
ncbi:hypothetical protein [Thiothrix lacustris]|uniref:hypothetical protein n=1 Tax=Thiothrix lacustris TaxID=525917 RepID=UPI0027E43D73|nr:hypothetical protein [Thiothrix lacustris]WMP18547.1 hypothetical protein RCS87_05690 [Thiothrix lacustris]